MFAAAPLRAHTNLAAAFTLEAPVEVCRAAAYVGAAVDDGATDMIARHLPSWTAAPAPIDRPGAAAAAAAAAASERATEQCHSAMLDESRTTTCCHSVMRSGAKE